LKDKRERLKLLESLCDLTENLNKDLDNRIKKGPNREERVLPWKLYKGSQREMPRVAVPTTCTSNPAVCLAYLLISQIKDIDIFIIEEDCKITMEVTPEISDIIDGMTLCVRKGEEIKTGSFGGRRKAVDNGFAIAMGQCCTYYCQEADKDRGYLMDLIPDDIRGTKEVKKASTELFGKMRTLYKKDENEHFLPTLIWLFNKWAYQHANTIGRSVMRCQKIGWDKVKRRSIPNKNVSRKLKGKTIWQTHYSSPKNVGASPLLSSAEKTLLKAMAKMGYYDVLSSAEEDWKKLSSEEQHDQYNWYVDYVKSHHKVYCDSAARVCGRQYKRRKYFEKITNKTLVIPKRKSVDPKAISKHLADITKEVFGSKEFCDKLPLQTSMWCLIVNTLFEDIITKTNEKQLSHHFENVKAKALSKARDLVLMNKDTVSIDHKDSYSLFVSTNQYSILDDEDDDIPVDEHISAGS
jgi:hypothetical protein